MTDRARALVMLLISTLLWGASPASGQATPPASPFAFWKVSQGNPMAVVLFVHGFGLHKGAFDALARRMQAEQIAGYAVDVRGCGEWRGTSESSQELKFDQSLVDIGSALLWIRNMHPGIPIVVLGESLGGAFAIQTAALYPQFVDGVIASVPSQDFFGTRKTLTRALIGALNPNNKLDLSPQILNQATQNKKLREKWKQDRRTRLVMSPKELVKLELFIRKTEELASQISDKPVLMLHGSRDRLAKQTGTIELFNRLPTKDKNLVMVGAAEHLILELGQFDDHTFNLVLDWVKQHCARPKAASAEPKTGMRVEFEAIP